jgi:crossover junction endodeoxyribonuclease RuvC
MIILGIDPGTATTGYGVIKRIQPADRKKHPENTAGFECIEYNVITTKPIHSAAYRLHQIHKELSRVIKIHKPSVIAVESLYFFKNLKTALPVSQARGVILMTAEKNKLEIHEFTPLQMKMIISGYGRADKKDVQNIIKELLALEEIPKPDDAADALGLAICCGWKITDTASPRQKKEKVAEGIDNNLSINIINKSPGGRGRKRVNLKN